MSNAIRMIVKSFALTLMICAWFLIRPSNALAAPSCTEVVITYQQCLYECANYPNVGGYCASAPSVSSQEQCYAYAQQYWAHWSGTCRENCHPEYDPPDLCEP